MKKMMFAVALVAAFTFASCGSKSQSAQPAADSTAVADSAAAGASAQVSPETSKMLGTLTAQVSQAIGAKNPKALTTALADMAATYKTLVNAGKLDEAKAYGEHVKAFVNKNAESLKSVAATAGNTTINDLVTSIKNLPTTAETTADEAKAAVSSDVVNLASPYIQKGAEAAATAETAADVLKNAPEAAATAAKTAASNAAATAENTAKTAVNNAATAAKSAAEAKVNEGKAAVNKAATDAQSKAAKKVTDAQKKANDAVNSAANKALKGIGL